MPAEPELNCKRFTLVPSSAWEPGLEAPLPEDAKQSFATAFPSRAWERVGRVGRTRPNLGLHDMIDAPNLLKDLQRLLPALEEDLRARRRL